jgi:hypothetical protein
MIKEAFEKKSFDKATVDVIVEEVNKQIELAKTANQLETKDLVLENENLKLKAKILAMELKLQKKHSPEKER